MHGHEHLDGVLHALYLPASTSEPELAMPTDDFNRADSTDLGANWTPPSAYSPMQIVSNAVRPTVTTDTNSGEYYAGTFTNDQYSQVVIKALPASSFVGCGPAVRMSASAGGYTVAVNTVAGIHLYGPSGVIGSYGETTPAVNDLIRLEAEGTAIRVYQNGTLRISTTDSNIASGNPGIFAYANGQTLADIQLDDWEGGNLGAPPVGSGVSFPRWRSVRR
jgi:hypothetical protein